MGAYRPKKLPQNVGRNKKQLPNKKDNGFNKDKIILVFNKIDRDGIFAFHPDRDDFNANNIMKKIIEYSTMTWEELLKQTHDQSKSKHHFLSYDSLSREAKERVNLKINETENECIFSFALNNMTRVIGIRDKEKFYVMWFDPNHQFCPSHK